TSARMPRATSPWTSWAPPPSRSPASCAPPASRATTRSPSTTPPPTKDAELSSDPAASSAASSTATNASSTYAAAGVDVEAGDRAVELMKAAASATHTAGVVGAMRGFAGLFDVSMLQDHERPLLAAPADGVRPKVAIAQAMEKHDTIGFDRGGMVVEDIIV